MTDAVAVSPSSSRLSASRRRPVPAGCRRLTIDIRIGLELFFRSSFGDLSGAAPCRSRDVWRRCRTPRSVRTPRCSFRSPSFAFSSAAWRCSPVRARPRFRPIIPRRRLRVAEQRRSRRPDGVASLHRLLERLNQRRPRPRACRAAMRPCRHTDRTHWDRRRRHRGTASTAPCAVAWSRTRRCAARRRGRGASAVSCFASRLPSRGDSTRAQRMRPAPAATPPAPSPAPRAGNRRSRDRQSSEVWRSDPSTRSLQTEVEQRPALDAVVGLAAGHHRALIDRGNRR